LYRCGWPRTLTSADIIAALDIIPTLYSSIILWYRNHMHSGMWRMLHASPQTQKNNTRSTTRDDTEGGAAMPAWAAPETREKWGGTPWYRHHFM
jgi:hypothetical protein